ncbi:hypothetical protein N9Z92_01790, partial [Akkermansiaceae bacterium]|nr:hypothetical protein [Akkermansiaceae bacterium]
WAGENGGAEVLALRPEVGPLHDRLNSLSDAGLELSLVLRPEDRYLRSFAKSGFFCFWKKLQSRMVSGEFPLHGQRELF